MINPILLLENLLVYLLLLIFYTQNEKILNIKISDLYTLYSHILGSGKVKFGQIDYFCPANPGYNSRQSGMRLPKIWDFPFKILNPFFSFS